MKNGRAGPGTGLIWSLAPGGWRCDKAQALVDKVSVRCLHAAHAQLANGGNPRTLFWPTWLGFRQVGALVTLCCVTRDPKLRALCRGFCGLGPSQPRRAPASASLKGCGRLGLSAGGWTGGGPASTPTRVAVSSVQLLLGCCPLVSWPRGPLPSSRQGSWLHQGERSQGGGGLRERRTETEGLQERGGGRHRDRHRASPARGCPGVS